MQYSATREDAQPGLHAVAQSSAHTYHFKRTNIHTRYLSAPLAIHLRGLTEEKEHEILAELDKVRINFERENVYCYHSLYSSIKPRKSELSSIFSPNNNVCSIYILIYTRNNISS